MGVNTTAARQIQLWGGNSIPPFRQKSRPRKLRNCRHRQQKWLTHECKKQGSVFTQSRNTMSAWCIQLLCAELNAAMNMYREKQGKPWCWVTASGRQWTWTEGWTECQEETSSYTMIMQCNAMQSNAMQCNTIQSVHCNAMQCNAMQCNAMQCNATQNTEGWTERQEETSSYTMIMQCNAMQCSTIQSVHCNAMQCNTMQCNAMQCNTEHRMLNWTPGGNELLHNDNTRDCLFQDASSFNKSDIVTIFEIE